MIEEKLFHWIWRIFQKHSLCARRRAKRTLFRDLVPISEQNCLKTLRKPTFRRAKRAGSFLGFRIVERGGSFGFGVPILTSHRVHHIIIHLIIGKVLSCRRADSSGFCTAPTTSHTGCFSKRFFLSSIKISEREKKLFGRSCFYQPGPRMERIVWGS